VVEPPPPGGDPDYPLPPREIVRGTGLAAAKIGDFGTRELEFAHTEPTRIGMLQVLGSLSTTDGYVATLPEWRGTVDTAGWERHRWLETRWRRPLGKQLEVTATIQGSEATRGLGTPYQHEHTRALFASVALAGQSDSGFAWNGVAYAQNRASNRTFSAVNPSRTTETPLIDEVAEPARQLGFSWTGMWYHLNDARTNIGVDVRALRGETKSSVNLSNELFTREIGAGGEQLTSGVFAIHHRRLTPVLRGMAGVRLDWWNESDGHWRETDRVSGAVLRDMHQSRSSELDFSPSAGLVWSPTKYWRLRTAVQGSFRPPSLAERYRTFGNRNRLVEPNPMLKTEHTASAEMSVDYTLATTFALSARMFASQSRDASGTRLIGGGSADGLVSSLPSDTIEHRERINLDRIRVAGAEISAMYRLQKTVTVEATLQLQNSRICDADETPLLAGHQMPYVPKHVASTTAIWQATAKLSVHGRVRWLGREFVNEENSRRLGEAIVADCGASYALTVQTEFFLQMNNLGDARVETLREATGVTYTSAPRMALAGVRVTW